MMSVIYGDLMSQACKGAHPHAQLSSASIPTRALWKIAAHPCSPCACSCSVSAASRSREASGHASLMAPVSL
jgi:hypothetical protein